MSVASLWLPILVSALAVFVVSSIIHMVLPYHRSDYRKAPGEHDLLALLRQHQVPPGDYSLPHGTPELMKDPQFREQMRTGPIAFLTVSSGWTGMGKNLAGWFVFCVVVSVFAAYLASRAVPAGGELGEVVRFAGTTAFAGYGLALWQNSIWYMRAVGTTAKSTFDSLIYALLTGFIMGWLWPA